MLSNVLVVCVVFIFCGICNGNQEKLVGGETQIKVAKISYLEKFINNTLREQSKASDQPAYKVHKFVCATQQVVAGLQYRIRYFGCPVDVNCEKNPSAQVKCTAVIWVQPWLVRDKQIVDTKNTCNDEDWDCEKSTTHSPQVFRQKRAAGNILGMEKPSLDDKSLFDQFIDNYNRAYSKDPESKIYQRRFAIFKSNLKVVKELNRLELGTAVYGITEFMDYTEDEYKMKAPGFTEPQVAIRKLGLDEIDTKAIPDSVDWRKLGAVTAVKNQGSCGSCWAFSTTGNIEGQWFIKKKKLLSLSEQELVDCDKLDQGCGGGLPSNAYKSIEKLGGVETEKEYPYEGSDDKCNIKKSDFRVYINDSVALPQDEGKLAAWLAAYGPISIGINANVMQFYSGGISHPWKIFCNPSSLDHGVLIVGYGTENGTPFWIIKNSWGSSWGEQGYYRIYRGDGSCGVNRMATSSIVD